MSEGTILDATIIHALSSTKNKDRKRNPEMKSTKKGNTWHFGMKAHMDADVKGRVYSVVTTAASVHDSKVMDACLNGKEKTIYGDRAYADQTPKEQAEANHIEWRVLRKARRGKRLNCAALSFNKKSNRTHARVEHPFGVIKHLWGYRKVSYRGLAKNTAHLFTLFARANIYMARRELPTP